MPDGLYAVELLMLADAVPIRLLLHARDAAMAHQRALGLIGGQAAATGPDPAVVTGITPLGKTRPALSGRWMDGTRAAAQRKRTRVS